MRVVIPRPLGGRGGGLGNELIPWAKAHLAAEALGARCAHPAWGLNPRAYWRHFRTSRWDVVWNRVLPRLLTSRLLDEAAYRAAGREDFGDAAREWARAAGIPDRGHLAVEVEGMWGGFLAIRRAAPFVLGQLLATRWAEGNLAALEGALAGPGIRIGVHVRRGDFHGAPPAGGFRGRFNVALPTAWYRHACRELERTVGADRARFLLVSDGASGELDELAREFRMARTDQLACTDVSDLLALARCDLLVCSVSTYSMVAAWLGGARYVWYRDQLQVRDGMLSVWGHEPAQADGATARHAEEVRRRDRRALRPRGVALGMGERLPPWIAEPPSRDDLATDLVMYGCIPEEPW